MKGILIKKEDEYILRSETGKLLAISNGGKEGCKLSKQNCDEIFGIVDVEKLVFCEFPNGNINGETSIEQKIKQFAFKVGFNKAMELNKDKVFTEEQLIEAMTLNRKHLWTQRGVIEHIKKQPTEIEVEIKMETINEGLDEMAQPQYAKVPKLDKNGRLILTKKI